MLVREQWIRFWSRCLGLYEGNPWLHCTECKMTVGPFVEGLDQVKARRPQRCGDLGVSYTFSPHHIDGASTQVIGIGHSPHLPIMRDRPENARHLTECSGQFGCL